MHQYIEGTLDLQKHTLSPLFTVVFLGAGRLADFLLILLTDVEKGYSMIAGSAAPLWLR